MAAQWVIEGLQEALDAVFKDTGAPEDKEIFLFSNNASISNTTVNGDLTPLTTNGLQKQTLVKASFGAATAANPVVSTYNGGTGVVFTATDGPNTVYGYGVRGVTSLKLYGASNFGLKTINSGEDLVIGGSKAFDFKLSI